MSFVKDLLIDRINFESEICFCWSTEIQPQRLVSHRTLEALTATLQVRHGCLVRLSSLADIGAVVKGMGDRLQFWNHDTHVQV